jgi:mono/diheme cytochrome c family protein
VINRRVCFASGLLAACGVAGILSGETPKTVLDGVYTEAQATRGQAAYERSCSRCHGAELDGGGQARPLHTNLFLDVWREDYLSSLFQFMQTRMPPGSAENSLPESDYVDILAYVLQVNKLPPGVRSTQRYLSAPTVPRLCLRALPYALWAALHTRLLPRPIRGR